MRVRRVLPAVAVALACGTGVATAQTPAPVSPRALLDQYCVTCHNPRNKANAGDLALDSVNPAQMTKDAETWERVVRKLRAGQMPPIGRPRPDPATYRQLLVTIQDGLDQAAVKSPNPGRKDTFHRLNRTEYQNIVRDLLDVDVDVMD